MSRLVKIIIGLLFGLSLAAPARALTNSVSQQYLTDYLEFNVFDKLAPQIYQDWLKNAIISRAGGQSSETSNCGFVPQPNSPEIINLIEKVQGCGGAADYVPLKVLQAIYWIEGTVAYANPSAYLCKKNWATALGLMQVTDGPYHNLTPGNEQLDNDEQQCSATGNFSRCYPNDAMEIAARVLLDKIYLWDKNGFQALGRITSKDDAYYASGRYYGSFQPNTLTNQLAKHLSPNLLYPAGNPNFDTLTYSEFVCAMSGFCSSYQDYPLRADKPYSGTKSCVNYNFYSACLHSGSSGSSGSNSKADAAMIEKLYGFKPATVQIHDYEINTPYGKFKLSKLEPKPLDNPDALTKWLTTATAKIWDYVPMFSREDTKGFIQNTSGATFTVIHPHLARTYEVSSALNLLNPFRTSPPPTDDSLPTVGSFLTGRGDEARTYNFSTIAPGGFKTYTPFVKEIADNLIGVYSPSSGFLNMFNTGTTQSKNVFGLGEGSTSSKFYYNFFGSLFTAKEQAVKVLQPFLGSY